MGTENNIMSTISTAANTDSIEGAIEDALNKVNVCNRENS